MKKREILFGAVDIGYRIKTYSDFIHHEFGNDLEAESLSKYVLPKTHYVTSYTYEFPIDKISSLKMYWKVFWFFLKALFKYDAFHFLSGETILTRKLRRIELFIYKFFGKKIIMHFVGSDIRSEKYLHFKNKHFTEILTNAEKITMPQLSEGYQLKLIADAKKYADEIIVSTPDLLKIIPTATYLPVMLNINEFLSQVNFASLSLSDTVKILHSPSGLNLKGSQYIGTVLQEIKQEYGDKIELFLPAEKKEAKLYATTRIELLQQFTTSDIVIDQMLIGWYGLKSVEALAAGNLVFCYIEKDLEKYIFENCPVINVNSLNLKEKLKYEIDKLLIENNREERRKTNLEFVYKWHDVHAYRDYFKKLWLSK